MHFSLLKSETSSYKSCENITTGEYLLTLKPLNVVFNLAFWVTVTCTL